MEPIAAIILLKIAGSLAGAVLALVFQPPKKLSEFVTRAVFSIMSGMLFGEAIHDYLKWGATWQMELAASALTAMLSWFVMGAVVRVVGRWMPPK